MYQTTRCRITIVWHCLMWPVFDSSSLVPTCTSILL